MNRRRTSSPPPVQRREAGKGARHATLILPPPAEVTVTRLGTEADGIATHPDDGAALFLPFTLPGESVRATATHKRGEGWAGHAEILAPSPDRIAPPCPHFTPSNPGITVGIKPDRKIEVTQGNVPLAIDYITGNVEDQVAVAWFVCMDVGSNEQPENTDQKALHDRTARSCCASDASVLSSMWLSSSQRNTGAAAAGFFSASAASR